jgi:hypothetical protein
MAVVRLAARKAAAKAGGVTRKALKRGAKAIPVVGAVVTLFCLKENIQAKGWVGGLSNSALDAIPGFGMGKMVGEIITGEDMIPDLPVDMSDVMLELEDIPNKP